MAGNPNWWSSSSGIHRQSQHIPSFLSTSSPFFASQYASEPSSQVFNSSADHDYQDFPQSWSQLLRGGFAGEGVRHGSSPFQVKKYDNWEDQIMNPSLRIPVVGVKQEVTQSCQLHNQEEDVAQGVRSYWSQVFMPPISSPRSCITTSSSNILDFYSNTKNQQYPDHSYECNSTATGGVPKKARVRASLTQPPLKVRKEKLGGRITALHQLVSPFGKTDTASVLLEVIGYIRFLQGQIEALSFPYLGNVSASMRHQQSVQEGRNYLYPEEAGQLYNDNCLKRRGAPYNQETKQDPPLKDLRSRGLCLVPVSSTHHVGSDTGADFWAPAIGGGF